MRLLLLVSALCVAPSALAQDLGPLEVRNLRAIAVPFLRMNPRSFVLGSGRTEWSFALEAANDMRIGSTGQLIVREDYEIDRFVVRYRKGIGRGSDLSVEVPLTSRGGGILDPVIDLWHRYVLHIPNTFREATPYGECAIDLPNHNRYGAAAGIGDVTVSLSNQSNPRMMATVGLKIPTGSSTKILGSGAFDLGLALQWLVPVKPKLDLYLQGAYIVQGHSRELPEARRDAFQQAIAFVYRYNSLYTAVVQWQGESAPLNTGVGRSDSTHQLMSFAIRRKLAENRILEAYLLEDGDWLDFKFTRLANIGPDLTLGLKYVVRF